MTIHVKFPYFEINKKEEKAFGVKSQKNIIEMKKSL